MASRVFRSPNTRPAKDEWGVYDPQQAGLAALFEKLEEKDAHTVAAPTAAARLEAMPKAPERLTLK